MSRNRANGWAEISEVCHVLKCPNGRLYRIEKVGAEWVIVTPDGRRLPGGEGVNGAKDAAELEAIDAGDLTI